MSATMQRPTPTRPTAMNLTRLQVVQRMTAALADHRWAFQGARTAVRTWIHDDTLADLDVWAAPESVTAVDGLLRGLGGVLVSATADDRRLMHRQYWVPTAHDSGSGVGAIVDVTVGDLRVGPTLLTPALLVQTRTLDVPCGPYSGVRIPVLTGMARVADLALRPLLRGRVVDGARLGDAVHEYFELTHAQRATLRGYIEIAVGTKWVDTVEQWLGGKATAEEMAAVRSIARRRLAVASLSPATLRATWAQRSLILPARRKGPAGLRSRGVVVALVGTDGSGKSTTATRLGDELLHAGFDVSHQYFGMARGNLPGVGLMRRLAGGGDTTTRLPAENGDAATQTDGPAAARPGLLQRGAAWVYVVDYWWRSLRRVRPQVRRGGVVLCDRWVSDLRRHPAPGTPAARVAEWLVGAPHVFVLADAPVDEIVARKPERTIAEAAAEQTALRGVGGELHGRPARGGGECVFHVVDTSARSGAAADARLLPVVRAVMTAAHAGLPGAGA